MLRKVLKQRSCTGLMVFAGLVSTSATASTADNYGFSPRSISLGNTSVAGGDESWAAYYNPAVLTDADRPQISFGLIHTNPNLEDLNAGTRQVEGTASLPADTYRASRAESTNTGALGLNLPLLPFLNFGLAALVPEKLLSMHGSSGNESNYLRYSDRSYKPEIYSAFGIKLPGGLSFGMGAYYSVAAKGNVRIGLSDVDSRGSMELSTEPVTVPYGGLRWQRDMSETGTLAVGLFYRKGYRTDVGLDTELTAGNSSFKVPAGVGAGLAAFYDPEITRVGMNYSTALGSVAVSVEQQDWSEYRARSMQLRGEDLALINGDWSGDQLVRLRENTVWRAGLEAGLGLPGLQGRIGYEFHTSPWDDDSVNVSWVDTEKQVWALGAGYSLKNDSGVGPKKISLDGAWQVTQLKDTSFTNPDGASFRAGGDIHVLTSGVTCEL